MIYMLSGRTKSGKSYEAVKYHILPALKSGRKVITNLALVIDRFKDEFGSQFIDDMLVIVENYDTTDFKSTGKKFHFSDPDHYHSDKWRHKETNQGPLVVIDECQFALGVSQVSKELKLFLTMHGHYGLDIILMTQQVKQVDRTVLGLVEITYRTIKNTAFGSSKTYTKKMYSGCPTSQSQLSNPETTSERHYDKKIFPFYISHTQSDTAVNDAKPNDITPLWRRWPFIGAFIGILVTTILLLTTESINPIKPDKPDVLKTKDSLSFYEKSLPENQKNLPQFQSSTVPKEKFVPKSSLSHPFSKIDLHITGSAQFGRSDNPKTVIFFKAYRKKVYLFDVSIRDLFLAGYDVEIITHCLVKLSHGDYEEYIVCDQPSSRTIEQTPISTTPFS